MKELSVSQPELEGAQWIALDTPVERRWVGFVVGVRAVRATSCLLLSLCFYFSHNTCLDARAPFIPFPSGQPRRLELLAGLQAGMANSAALLSQTFGPAAAAGLDGQTACSVNLPSATGLQLHVSAANAAFQARFFQTQELHKAFVHKRTIHLVLSALLVAPEDREAYFDTFFRVFLSATPQRIVQFGKVSEGGKEGRGKRKDERQRLELFIPFIPCTTTFTQTQGFDRNGRIQLHICEARPAHIDAHGVPHGIALKIEPAPPSRHIGQPGTRSIVDSFRKDSSSSGSSGGGGTSSRSSSPLSVSGDSSSMSAHTVPTLRLAPAWLNAAQALCQQPQQVQQQQLFGGIGGGGGHQDAAAAGAAAAAGMGLGPLPAVRGMAALPLAVAPPCFFGKPAAPPPPPAVAAVQEDNAAALPLLAPTAVRPAAAGAAGTVTEAAAAPAAAASPVPELSEAFLEAVFSKDEEEDEKVEEPSTWAKVESPEH